MMIDRRNFVKKATLAGVGTATLSTGAIADPVSKKKSKKKPSPSALNNIKLGFIGVGNRGRSHLRNSINVGSSDIIAICDISENSINAAQEIISGTNRPAPKVYSEGEFAYLDMLEKEDLDAVIISTPWRWHGRMAVAGMEAGAYTGLEVPASVTLDECWDLVKQQKRSNLDVYDAASWSAISHLSEMSITKGGTPVDFPDFTRGHVLAGFCLRGMRD